MLAGARVIPWKKLNISLLDSAAKPTTAMIDAEADKGSAMLALASRYDTENGHE